jgi:hypothetical protein
MGHERFLFQLEDTDKQIAQSLSVTVESASYRPIIAVT